MKEQMTPPQALLRYMQNRPTAHSILGSTLGAFRGALHIFKKSFAQDLISITNTLASWAQFICEHQQLAGVTQQQLQTLEQDLQIYRAIYREAIIFLNH